MPLRSCWTKRANNPIPRKLDGTAGQRQCFRERNFVEGAVQHGFTRARRRGLWRQSIADYLIVAIRNLRIIAKSQKNLLLAFDCIDPGSVATRFTCGLQTLVG
jgi:hypothetical protein